MRTHFHSVRALIAVTACFASCCMLSACSENKMFESIEQVSQDDFGEPRYEDGLYLTQEVREPAEDPYADDTRIKSEGETGGIRYALYERHAEIIGHTKDFSETNLTVPKEIEGKPVSRIASVALSGETRFELDDSGAFYGCYSLESVTIPDTVTEIGEYAFYGCKNLRTVSIPESVSVIGTRAFSMCRSLADMAVPTRIGYVGDSAFAQTPWYDNLLFHHDLVIFNGMLYDVGQHCGGNIEIPDYVVSICDYAFYDTAELRTVTIPESVKKIGKAAFCSCPMLSTIVFDNPECEITEEPTTICNRNVENEYRFNGTIRGSKGSTAQKYADKYGYPFSSEMSFSQDETLPAETTTNTTETTETTAESE